ncbi:MFS transporter [Paenibacillus filicis]|uniref:MFS transporter n=1 Tax=Paenibacillus gyeongsangnamensis TaxID=3388067 RepID=A0ABT4Q6K7_9BACL|nr:MFS transporter [Paenibacillus filicis]MCZ8512505.1 MFS transporter [Paenibacillus filicis]
MIPESTSSALWTKSFILLTLCNLCIYMNIQMITPSLPAYVAGTLGGGGMTVSLVISLFALSAIVTRLFTAAAFKRFGLRTILFGGLIIFAISTAGYAAVATLGLLLVIRIVYGIGFGFAGTAFGTLVSQVIPVRRMGEGMGYFGLSTSLSMSLAPVIGLWLLNGYGFHRLILVSSALAALVFVFAAWIKPSEASHKEERPVSAAAAAQAPERMAWFDPGAMFPCLLSLLLSVTYGGLISFIALFGKETNLGNVGWFFLFNAMMVLVVRPFSGKLFDRKGHAAVLPAGAVFTGLGLVLLSYTGGMVMLLLSALCYGVGYGMLQPSLQAWTIQRSKPGRRAAATGLFYNSIDLGIAIGSFLLGYVSTVTGYAGMYRWSASAMVLFIALYAAYLLLSRKSASAPAVDRI